MRSTIGSGRSSGRARRRAPASRRRSSRWRAPWRAGRTDMSNDSTITPILSALEIAAFERRPDGSFVSLVPVPEWFSVLGKDQTFPFLGTFLEDARIHWASSPSGRLRSGLCSETDDYGREFHFEVSAIVLAGRNLLVFELAPALEGMRLALQKARQQ